MGCSGRMSEDDEMILGELAALFTDSTADPETLCSFKDGMVAPWVTQVEGGCEHSPYPVCLSHAAYMRDRIGMTGFCAVCGQGQVVTVITRK